MNLLKEIAVTGTIHPTHTRLSLQFTFHNPTTHPLSPTYLFPLPKSASITGLQILTEEKNLLRAEISPLTDSDTNQDGFRLIQLDSQLYSLTWECLPAGDTCTVLLECLLHLLPQKGRCRLVLPFGISFGSQGNTSPCPANLDLILEGLVPLHLSPQDSFDPNTKTFSSTAQTDADFVLDLLVQHPEPCGYLQEEFGKGCGFARIYFPADSLKNQPDKLSVLLLLDLSHAGTLRIGNSLKELFFRLFSAIPDGVSVQCLTTREQPIRQFSGDSLYQHLQSLPVGMGNLDELLHSAAGYQTPNGLTILVSDGSYLPSALPDFPVLLATVGAVRQTVLSLGLKGEHLHFYPKDDQEKELTNVIESLLSSKLPLEVLPEGGNIHDCIIHSPERTLTEGYLDVAFSYSGQAPHGFSLWQDGKKMVTCPLPQTKVLSRFPDAEQLFAMANIQKLTELLKKASPVSRRSIKKELAHLQTSTRILGTETILVIPTESGTKTCIPTRFYSVVDGLTPLANRPTIFGEGIRTLPQAERTQLTERCREVIYHSLRSDGSIHSPLGITPQMKAEETTLSYLALLADGKTDSAILQDVFAFLRSAPETPWSFLIRQDITKESLQKLLPSFPDFETLLASLGDSLPLMTAAYLLLWISLM